MFVDEETFVKILIKLILSRIHRFMIFESVPVNDKKNHPFGESSSGGHIGSLSDKVSDLKRTSFKSSFEW